MDVVTAAGAITGSVGAVSALVGGLAVWRKSRSEAATGLASHLEEHMDRQDRKIAELERRLDLKDRRERVLIDYIFQLQLHIQSGGEPPGPPWPASLLPSNE